MKKPNKNGPFLRGEDSTHSMMSDVALALTPAFIWGIYAYGFRALLILAVTVLSAALAEWLMEKAFGRKGCFSDLSFLSTSFVFAALLPPSVPLWLPPLGAFLAICFFKHLFGGLGHNLLNPALSSYLSLRLLFPEAMTAFTEPFSRLPVFTFSFSKEELAPISSVYHGFSSFKELGYTDTIGLSQFLTGSVGGGIASSSVMLLLAGGLYLLVRRVISLAIPVSMTLTAALLYYAFPMGYDNRLYFMFYALGIGTAVFTAVFVATDPVTSPVTGKGRVLYGVLLGALTVFFRYRILWTEGAYLAVFLLSLTARFWDFFFRPRVYGKKRHFVGSVLLLPKTLSCEWQYRKKAAKTLLERIAPKKKG